MKPMLAHTAELNNYNFAGEHPMGSYRVSLALALANYIGLVELFDIVEPPPASDELLLTVHDPAYLAALRSGQEAPEFGIGDVDHPVTPGLPDVASRIVAATTFAAEQVWNGTVRRAVNLSGGLHHAAPAKLSGFCMFNDTAVAIKRLLDKGAQRIVYLDLDAHHGDGVEQIFWDDPRVLTISIHESGLYLFPGTGFAHDIGGPDALGTAVNIALDRGTQDEAWIQAVHGIVPMLLQVFRPEMIISQHGADAHFSDPLADLELTVDAQGMVYRTLGYWADRYANGKWLALGGGGYNKDAVARSWVYLLAAVADVEFDPTIPIPSDGPLTSATIGDPGADDTLRWYKPGAIIAEKPGAALVQTSRAVFPYWGLTPYTS